MITISPAGMDSTYVKKEQFVNPLVDSIRIKHLAYCTLCGNYNSSFRRKPESRALVSAAIYLLHIRVAEGSQ